MVLKLNVAWDAFAEKPADTIFVVVMVFVTAKFVNGWTMFEASMFERVFP